MYIKIDFYQKNVHLLYIDSGFFILSFLIFLDKRTKIKYYIELSSNKCILIGFIF